MINVAVWPYSTGEVILQNYNVLLTLSSLLSHSDGILPIFNDDLLSACRHLLKLPRPSYSTMNQVLAHSLLSVFYPASNSPAPKLPLWSCESNCLAQVVARMAPDPSYRVIGVQSVPKCSAKVSEFNSDLWEGMLQRVRQMHLT